MSNILRLRALSAALVPMALAPVVPATDSKPPDAAVSMGADVPAGGACGDEGGVSCAPSGRGCTPLTGATPPETNANCAAKRLQPTSTSGLDESLRPADKSERSKSLSPSSGFMISSSSLREFIGGPPFCELPAHA